MSTNNYKKCMKNIKSPVTLRSILILFLLLLAVQWVGVGKSRDAMISLF